VVAKAGDKLFQLNFNQIQEHMLNYIEVKENHTRKVGTRKQPFWLDGSSKIQTFKGNDFIEYCFRNANNKDLKMISRMREKYGIDEPREFKGVQLHFDEQLFDEI
jgi:hypothetical protein